MYAAQRGSVQVRGCRYLSCSALRRRKYTFRGFCVESLKNVLCVRPSGGVCPVSRTLLEKRDPDNVLNQIVTL